MSKAKKTYVFVELIQNGQLLSSVKKPFHKSGSIKLTANPNGELSAPYYPLSTDIEIARLTGKSLEVDLDHNWEGFTTFEGRIEEISSDRKTDYIHIMKNGDYGSIAYNDLRVLIRIGYKRKQKHRQLAGGRIAKPQLTTYLISNPFEAKALGIGVLAAAWLFGMLVFGLNQRKATGPQKLSDLEEVYTLPFVYPKHLENLPEAIQDGLDRKRLVATVYDYYADVAQVLMGYFPTKSSMLFESTIKKYRSLYDKKEEAVTEIEKEEIARLKSIKRKKDQSVIYIPSILGQSLTQDVARIQQVVRKTHRGLEANLLNRTAMSKAFTADNKYDFEQYKAKTRFDKGKKFKPWGFTKDQRRMYEEAKELARRAAWHQQSLRKAQSQNDQQWTAATIPVTLQLKHGIVASIDVAELEDLNQKLNAIQAASFETRKTKTIKEPLVGEIDPALISRIIKNNKFELQLCFELALRRNQGVAGTMEWQWRLDSRGQISDMQLVKSTIEDSRMIQCVRQKIASWKFPRPRKGAIQVSYPFQFKPNRG